MKKNKIYFASDFHLGYPNIEESHKREKLIVQWLNNIEKQAKTIYLIGDIFDFWFEYKYVVPKGFIRLLGKIANLIDNGTEVIIITGNHDLWMKDYLKKEIGVKIIHGNMIINEAGKKILVGHGDGLGKGDKFYKFLKKIFTSSFCQWIFTRLHPNLAFTIANNWSRTSRKNQKKEPFLNKEEETLYQYCQEQQQNNSIDYYIFGHRHIPLCIDLDEKSKYINTGDWIEHYTYIVLDSNGITLKKHINN